MLAESWCTQTLCCAVVLVLLSTLIMARCSHQMHSLQAEIGALLYCPSNDVVLWYAAGTNTLVVAPGSTMLWLQAESKGALVHPDYLLVLGGTCWCLRVLSVSWCAAGLSCQVLWLQAESEGALLDWKIL